MSLKKRSFTLSKHRTSVALEAEFWAVIDASAARERLSLAALVAKIDATRGERPLASALRDRSHGKRMEPISSRSDIAIDTKRIRSTSRRSKKRDSASRASHPMASSSRSSSSRITRGSSGASSIPNIGRGR